MESRYKSFVKNAKVNNNKNDQSSQKITSNHTPRPPGCPPLVFKGFKIQSPKTSQCVQIMFKAEYIHKNYAFSRFDHTTRKKTHQNELDGWKHDGWALASWLNIYHTFFDLKTCLGKSYRHSRDAQVLFDLNDDELLPDLHITRAGVLRVGI